MTGTGPPADIMVERSRSPGFVGNRHSVAQYFRFVIALYTNGDSIRIMSVIV
jgi:hypothetical protein